MAQQHIAGLAALIALGFALAAIHGCASSEQPAAAIAKPAGLPEFHGARLGNDTLRSRLDSE